MATNLTIQDIARLAGVSKATVSRVLNGNSHVNSVTRERVLHIINEHRFVPNSAATGLAGGQSRIISMLTPTLTWNLIPEIMRGVAELIEKTSYELLLYPIGYETDHSDVLNRILASKLTTGLLAVLVNQASQYLTDLYEQGLPVVIINDQLLPTSVPWVGADNRGGAYTAVHHLIQLGHRRIAHIQGKPDVQVSIDRYEGYLQALLDAGLAPDPDLILEGNFQTASGYSCACSLFEMPDRPGAIFAANDEMAYGVLEAAEQYHLRVPEDIAVIGFDDVSFSARTRPGLTTVHQPFYEMGQCAVELLLSLMNPRYQIVGRWLSLAPDFHPELPLASQNPVRLQLKTHLVVRGSCGARKSLTSPSEP